MAQFDFTAQQVTAETTAEYRFPFIPGTPSIIFAPAHDSNPVFHDERLRLALEASDKEPQRAADITVESLKQQEIDDRERDRKLLSRTCARAWGVAPKDIKGAQPEFSVENCYDFFVALPEWMFDPMRNWVTNLYNFVKRPPVTEDEAAKMGNE